MTALDRLRHVVAVGDDLLHEGPQARREVSHASHGGPPGATRIQREATDLRALGPCTGAAALRGPKVRGSGVAVTPPRGPEPSAWSGGAGGSWSEATSACEHPTRPSVRGAAEGRDRGDGPSEACARTQAPSDPRVSRDRVRAP